MSRTCCAEPAHPTAADLIHLRGTMNKRDSDTHPNIPAAPSPDHKGQPSTSKPEGLDKVLEDGPAVTQPDQKDRAPARK